MANPPIEPIIAQSSQYQAVAASQTATAIGPGDGAQGDYLSHICVVPETTSPGAITVTDGSGSAITVFTGGTGSVLTLHPFIVPLGMISTSGAWKVATGANVHAIALGRFT